MKLSEIYEVADEIAPKALSDEYCRVYGAYDNSGILLDSGEETDRIVFSLDLSLSAAEEAVKRGAKLIVTHHPAIYSKIGGVRVSDFDPLGKKLSLCLKNGISVISMHLNLDVAEGGIDESLMRGIRRAAGCPEEASDVQIMQPLGSVGYGRSYGAGGMALADFAKAVKEEFRAEHVAVYGDGNRKIGRAASFCGAGSDEAAVEFAVRSGADVIVSSDFRHHILTLARETGLAVVQLTHYASENYGFEKYYQKIRRRVEIPCDFHTDNAML